MNILKKIRKWLTDLQQVKCNVRASLLSRGACATIITRSALGEGSGLGHFPLLILLSMWLIMFYDCSQFLDMWENDILCSFILKIAITIVKSSQLTCISIRVVLLFIFVLIPMTFSIFLPFRSISMVMLPFWSLSGPGPLPFLSVFVLASILFSRKIFWSV